MNSREQVTILMPTYNAAEYIDASVLSILAQTHRNFRLLAYDDFSTDSTFDKLRFWMAVDPRVVAVRPFSQHTGYIELLNQMIEDSNTHYIARQDADDISMPRRLEMQYKLMAQKRKAVLSGTQGVNIIQNEGVRVDTEYPWESQFVNPVASNDKPVNDDMKSRHRVIHGSMFMVRDAVREVGNYDPALVPIEDWDIALRLGEIGEVYVVPEVLYIRRIHDRNISKLHPNKAFAVEMIKQKHGIEIDIPSTRPAHL